MNINEVLENSYNDFEAIVREIYKHNTCKYCAGSFLNVSCKYCGMVDLELDNLVTKLNIELTKLEMKLKDFNVSKLPDNHLFNLLMVLKDRDIPLLDMLLEQYNYQQNYYDLYKSSLVNQNAGKDYSDLEISAIESMIYSNDQNVDLINYYNMFIRNALLQKQNVSYDCFKVLIKRFLELQMKNIYPNAECIIDSNLREECGGNSLFTKTRINELDVRNLYEGKSFFLIFIMTHELQHTYQYKEIFSDEHYITPFLMDQIKEFAIHNLDYEYYYQNHDNISFEKEAEAKGIVDALNYFKALGIELLNEKYYIAKKENLESKMYDQERVLNGEVTTIDKEFQKVIVNCPQALTKFRKLGLLYKVVDNMVVAKTNEELSFDLEKVLNNPSLDENTKNMYKEFYCHYMTDSRNF